MSFTRRVRQQMMIVNLTRLPNPVEFDEFRSNITVDIEQGKGTLKSASSESLFSLPCVDRKDTTVKALRRNGFAVLQSYAQEKYPPLNLILFTISKPILFHEFYSKPLAFGCKHDRFFLPSPQISPCASNLSRTEKSYPFQQRRSSVSSVLCGFLRIPIVLRSCHEVRYISKSVSS